MLVNLNSFRDKKKREADIDTLKEMLVALKDAYRHLHPYAKYPLFFNLLKELLYARIDVRENIERLQKKDKEYEEIYRK